MKHPGFPTWAMVVGRPVCQIMGVNEDVPSAFFLRSDSGYLTVNYPNVDEMFREIQKLDIDKLSGVQRAIDRWNSRK